VKQPCLSQKAALEAASDPDCAVANVSYRRDCALSAYACPAASRRSGAEVEIIGELDAGLRLACANARTETAAQPHFLAQGPYRCSVKWGFLQYHFQMRRIRKSCCDPYEIQTRREPRKSIPSTNSASFRLISVTSISALRITSPSTSSRKKR
jgi:hypothetical protein